MKMSKQWGWKNKQGKETNDGLYKWTSTDPEKEPADAPLYAMALELDTGKRMYKDTDGWHEIGYLANSVAAKKEK